MAYYGKNCSDVEVNGTQCINSKSDLEDLTGEDLETDDLEVDDIYACVCNTTLCNGNSQSELEDLAGEAPVLSVAIASVLMVWINILFSLWVW